MPVITSYSIHYTKLYEQSFERAARALHLTQPAISQRIKQLEQLLAQPVLLRSSPPCPTLLGQQRNNFV